MKTFTFKLTTGVTIPICSRTNEMSARLRPNFLITFLLVLMIPFAGVGQTQIGLDIDGEAAGDISGISVCLSSDGTKVAIGAFSNDGINGTDSGHVRVYENIAGTWTQVGSDIDGEAEADQSGLSVSINGNGTVVAIGAFSNDGNGTDSGHVRVYENIAGTWTQVGSDIDGEAAGDQSGLSVSINGNGTVVAIGAKSNSGINGISGHVRVYENSGGTWTQVGSDIDGEAAGDGSGGSISLSSDGTKVAIGAFSNDGINGTDSGHVRVYENIAGTWTQVGSDIDGEAEDDKSGWSVSLSSDGTVVAIGAIGNDGNGNKSGHVRVYENSGGTWTQVGSDIDGEAAGDQLGAVSLSSDGTVVATGARFNDGINVNFNNSGHVRVYENSGGTWTQVNSDIDGEAEADQFGYIVSLSSDGEVVASGAPNNNGINGANSGHVRVFDTRTLGVDNLENYEESVEIYPNPVRNIMSIDSEFAGGYQIYDINGRNVGKGNILLDHNEVDTSLLQSGLYFIKISNDKGSVTKKVIKE